MSVEQTEKIPVSKSEQETVIVVDPETERARIYSCVPSMMRRMKTALENPEAVLIADDKYGIQISVPMTWIKLSKPQKKTLSEERREALRNRMTKVREMKGKEE